jgi:DnaJ family protein C protein 12
VQTCRYNAQFYLQAEQITAEYKVQALQFHPDKNAGNKQAEEKFQKLKVRTFNARNVKYVSNYTIQLLRSYGIPYVSGIFKCHFSSSFQEAKETLCDPEKRINYDKWRKSGIAISYKQWLGMKEHVQAVSIWKFAKCCLVN